VISHFLEGILAVDYMGKIYVEQQRLESSSESNPKPACFTPSEEIKGCCTLQQCESTES
jgi:hypothetical protein